MANKQTRPIHLFERPEYEQAKAAVTTLQDRQAPIAKIREAADALEEVTRDLSFEANSMVRPAYAEGYRRTLSHLEAAIGEYCKIAELPVEIQRLGYRASSQLLPELFPNFAQVIADVAKFRQALQEEKII